MVEAVCGFNWTINQFGLGGTFKGQQVQPPGVPTGTLFPIYIYLLDVYIYFGNTYLQRQQGTRGALLGHCCCPALSVDSNARAVPPLCQPGTASPGAPAQLLLTLLGSSTAAAQKLRCPSLNGWGRALVALSELPRTENSD